MRASVSMCVCNNVLGGFIKVDRDIERFTNNKTKSVYLAYSESYVEGKTGIDKS